MNTTTEEKAHSPEAEVIDTSKMSEGQRGGARNGRVGPERDGR